VTSAPEQTHGGVVALGMGTATALPPATCNCHHNISLYFGLRGCAVLRQGSGTCRYFRYKECIRPCKGDQRAMPLCASKVSHPIAIIDFPLFYWLSDIHVCVILSWDL
jgi:hypothetical protein